MLREIIKGNPWTAVGTQLSDGEQDRLQQILQKRAERHHKKFENMKIKGVQNMEKHAKMWLDIKKIDQENSIQMREFTDLEVVAEYAEALKAGQELPPVTVYREGTSYYLADGWHRLKANESIGNAKIEVVIVAGTKRDATLHAIGANANHGRRRTLADKEKAVLFLLNDPEWKQLSDQELLRHAKITDIGFVRKVREKYGVKANAVKMVRRGDKLFKVDTRNMGKNGRSYAAEIAAMPYNKKVSAPIARVISVLDEQLLTPAASGKLGKEKLLALRKKLVTGLAEFENRLLAKKINSRK